MKPCERDETKAAIEPIVGDQIGSTAYSERFVLRLMLKLSEPELPTNDTSLEQDLCVLWDMTAENDVIEFLMRHSFLEQLQFSWERIPSPRITEIFLGILANMCCNSSVITELRDREQFCLTIVQLVHSDDSSLLVQVMRIIKACLYEADHVESAHWLRIFASADFTLALAFILAYSSNKDLLINCLETFNVICNSCNTENTRVEFVKQFVTQEIADGVCECIKELGINQQSDCERDELERAFVVSLEITMNLVGFDVAVKFYEDKSKISSLMSVILEHYKSKAIEDNEVDDCLIDIFDSFTTINNQVGLHKDGDTEICVTLTYEMWTHLCSKKSRCNNEKSDFENSVDNELVGKLNKKFASFMFNFTECCPEENFEGFLKMVGNEFEEIASVIEEENPSLHTAVIQRISDHNTNR